MTTLTELRDTIKELKETVEPLSNVYDGFLFG